ncbi:hypothetical protein C8Q77DRAFT_1030299, partial [Trametes polyzona]
NYPRVDLDEHVWLDGAARLDDWFWNSTGLALEALRVPCSNEKIENLFTGAFDRQRRAPLLRLPPELLHEIIRALNPTDAYAPAVLLFATTCKLALALAHPHITRLQRKHFAPLAGHRLLCLPDGPSPLAACPPGLFSPADADMLGEGPAYALVRKAWRRCTPDPPALLRPADLMWRPSAVSRMS